MSTLADDSGGSAGTHLEDYGYLGSGTIVFRGHPEDGVNLSYAKLTAEPVGDAGDQYTGLDRFGRVVDQRWIDGSDVERKTGQVGSVATLKIQRFSPARDSATSGR